MNTSNTLSSFLKRFRAGAHQDPARDWMILLIFSVITLAGIIVWNVWAFDTIAGGGTIGSRVVTEPPIFSRSSLDSVHSIFEKRSAEEEKYVSGVYRYADPSQ